ncbi:MAG: hypothetical protein H0U74_04060 [Bradymonadaceae bacterium]|nr:hypothetical protein [Lujinxingiaceae bacterium]
MEAPASGVTFNTETNAYVRTETVNLSITNNTTHEVGYNLCFLRIDRHVEGTWQASQNFPDFCEGDTLRLEGGTNVEHNLSMAETMPAGEYRVVTYIENPLGSDRQQVETAVFSLKD